MLAVPTTTTMAATTTTVGVTSTQDASGGAGGCPPFDVSTCDISCVTMDAGGCLGCKCPTTTACN